MSALARIRGAGFEVWLKDNGNIGIRPFNAMAAEQVAYIKEHKAEIVKELAANDAEATTPTAEPKTSRAVTCKTCVHFESHHRHGGGSGACKAGVTPYGACWWSDDLHMCGEYSPIAPMIQPIENEVHQ